MTRTAADLHNMGCALMEKSDYAGAEKRFLESILVNPDADRLTYTYLGTALMNQGKWDEASYWDKQAIKAWPGDPKAHVEYAMSRLRIAETERHFIEGWREWEWRRLARNDERIFDIPRWDGKKSLNGKTLFIFCEEGLGDTIQFLRYIPLVHGDPSMKYVKIILEVQPHLEVLVRNSVAKECVTVIARNVFDLQNEVKADYCIPLLSLAGIFWSNYGPHRTNIPYLKSLICLWPNLDGRKNVGIVCQGNKAHSNDKLRSIDPTLLKPLLDCPQVNWISLQQEGIIEGTVDLRNDLNNFNRTAAVIDSMDLVITVDTAVAHVAGALGTPCWLLLPFVSDWRWGLGTTNQWYDSVKLFRQSIPGDWKTVITNVKTKFEQEIPNKLVLKTETRYGPMNYFTNERWVGRALDYFGEFSEGECELFRKIIKPGQTVVDGGANIGYHTNVFSKIVGSSGTVIAVEPLPEVFQLLTENLTINDCRNVVATNAALSDKTGTIARGELPEFGGEAIGPNTLTLIKLDQIDCHVDFIKLDIEGMEWQALQGGEKLIIRDSPILYVENDRPEKSALLISWLLEHGYRCFWHLPPMFNMLNFKKNTRNPWADCRSVNMLCYPSGKGMNLPGIKLKPILSPQSNWKDAI